MRSLFVVSWLSWLLVLTGPQQTKLMESALGFQISNAGLQVDGTFSGLTAEVQFDPAHPEQAHLRASVPVASIKTGIALRDRHLQKPDYFDAGKYPDILLQSKTIRPAGAGKYEGVFDLTMKGVTREVKLPFTVSAAREFQGQLQVNRLDFGIGKSSIILSNNVTINIRVKLAAGS